MIARFLPLIIFFFSLNLLQAQEVPEVQTPLVTKISATWCPPCGTWGWDLFEHLLEDNGDKAILLAAHHSGDLLTLASQDLMANFGATYQPRFFVNNTNILANSGNVDAKRMEVGETVSQMNGQTPLVNTGLLVTRENNKYTIKAKTKFFADVVGDIRLTIMAIESGIDNFQNSRPNAIHDNVVRGIVGSETFGIEIANGSVSTGFEKESTYTMDLENGWNPDNMEFVALLWSKVDNKYNYMNGSKTAETMTSAVNDQINNSFIAEWRKDGINSALFLNASEPMGQSSISVYNTNGQLLDILFEGNLNAGIHSFPFSVEALNGNYFINIKSEAGTSTVKIQ